MQQPSAQGIASLYRGNPQPLQQSIQKDQQAKPGLPPDLQKMLALQIVNNEKDATTAQAAMDQLKQMSGQQGGKPPTVMQSLEQQAQQKMQAQAVQAQQKQQGIQALMQQQAPASGVPEGTPQPEMQPQPQGIDQLPADFTMARGGIVSFEGGGEIEQEIQSLMDARERYVRSGSDTRGIDQAISTLQKKAQAEKSGPSEEEYAKEMAAAGMDRPVQVTGMPKPPQFPVQNTANQSDAETARLQRQKSLPQAPVNDLAALARQKQQAAPPAAPAPAAPRPPVATPPPPAQVVTPTKDSEAMGIEKEIMRTDPKVREAEEIQKFKTAVPAPDTSQHDRLIDELEKRKQDLAPKQGYEGLMEYLSDISRADSRGRGSFAAGAAGARINSDREKENKLQQFELSKQAIDVSQKKLDTVRAYAEKTYGVGKAAFDQVYKDRHDAAKEVIKDESAAARLAKEETLRMLEMENQLQRQRMQGQNSLAVANVAHQSEAQFIKDWMSKPENKGKSFSDAYAAFKSVGPASERNDIAGLKAVQAGLIKEISENLTMNAATKATKQAQIDDINKQILSLSGSPSGAPSSGKVPPPPPGFKVN